MNKEGQEQAEAYLFQQLNIIYVKESISFENLKSQ